MQNCPFSNCRDTGSQHGNALFLILIAVALFAALSYAITQSGRGGGTITKEKNKLLAAQLVQTMGEIEQGYNKMILLGATPPSIAHESMFSTGGDNPGWGSANGYGDFCSTGTDCLFSPDGGGVAVPSIPLEVVSSNHYGLGHFGEATGFNGIAVENEPYVVNSVDVGTSAADLEVIMPDITRDICVEINKGLGLNIDPDDYAPDNAPSDHSACVHSSEGAGYYRYYLILRAL